MRVDILANDRASFIQPMAEGLARMLRSLGVDAHLHLDGLAHLMRALSVDFATPRSFVGSTTKLLGNRREFSSFVEKMRGTHLVVVVAAVPSAFSPSAFPNIEALRRLLPNTPIVNYDLHYLPSISRGSRKGSSGSSVTIGISWCRWAVMSFFRLGLILIHSSE